MKKYNIGISVVMVLFAAWIFYATKDFPEYYSGAPGSGFWPRVLAVALVIISLALVIATLVSDKGKKAGSKGSFNYLSVGMKRVYMMLAVMVLTGISIKFLGFVITSLWFSPAVMLIMGERKWLRLVISSVTMTACIYVIFACLLKMFLPQPFFM